MSEHRRKIPQPEYGGRATARRNYGTASHGAGRRPAPTPRISPEATPATPVAAPAAEKSHSRFKPYAGRTAMAGVLLAASGAVVLHEEPKAQSVPVAADSVPHAVYRTGGDGLYLHDGPGLDTPLMGTMPDGMQFTVDCFTLDDPVNGNPVWLEGTAADGRHGSASDYYIDTHWNTTQDLVNQGIEQCGTQAPAASAPEQQPTQPQQNSNEDYKGQLFRMGSCRGALWSILNQEICVLGMMGEKDKENDREWIETVNASSPDAGPGTLEVWGEGFYHKVEDSLEHEWKIRKWLPDGTNVCAAGTGTGARVVTCFKIEVE